MTLSLAVETYLDARLPGWQNRIRIGRFGGRHLPIPCEVCGKVIYHRASDLESRARLGKTLPRYCSLACSGAGRSRERAAKRGGRA